MAIEKKGEANHVHEDKSISTIIISLLNTKEEGHWITLDDSENDFNSVAIFSIEQWNKVDAFVRKTFEDM